MRETVCHCDGPVCYATETIRHHESTPKEWISVYGPTTESSIRSWVFCSWTCLSNAIGPAPSVGPFQTIKELTR